MAEQEKQPFWCNACQLEVPLDQTKVTDIQAAEGEWLFFAQTVHALCGTPVQEKDNKIRVAELRPRGIGKTAEAEADRAAWHHQEALTDAFVSNAMRVHVQHTEQTLKEMLRRAIELVEQNPRNEPMRTEIPRSAVERMLAEDLRAFSSSVPQVEGLAAALFDAGWRPTIDRLAR